MKLARVFCAIAITLAALYLLTGGWQMGKTYTRIEPVNLIDDFPQDRVGQALVWHEASQQVIMIFGGSNWCQAAVLKSDNTLGPIGGNSTDITTLTEQFYHSAVYDPASEKIYIIVNLSTQLRYYLISVSGETVTVEYRTATVDQNIYYAYRRPRAVVLDGGYIVLSASDWQYISTFQTDASGNLTQVGSTADSPGGLTWTKPSYPASTQTVRLNSTQMLWLGEHNSVQVAQVCTINKSTGGVTCGPPYTIHATNQWSVDYIDTLLLSDGRVFVVFNDSTSGVVDGALRVQVLNISGTAVAIEHNLLLISPGELFWPVFFQIAEDASGTVCVNVCYYDNEQYIMYTFDPNDLSSYQEAFEITNPVYFDNPIRFYQLGAGGLVYDPVGERFITALQFEAEAGTQPYNLTLFGIAGEQSLFWQNFSGQRELLQ